MATLQELAQEAASNFDAASIPQAPPGRQPLRPLNMDLKAASQEAARSFNPMTTGQQEQMTHFSSEFDSPTGGAGGLQDFTTRAKLSFMETFDEKQRAFQSAYPEGELNVENVNGSPTIVFRTGPDDAWKTLDRAPQYGLEMSDLADLAGAAPELLGELAAGILTRGRTMLGNAARLAGGAMVGHGVEEGAESLAGLQQQGLGEIAVDTLGEGVASGLGTVATGAISGPANILRNRGIQEIPESAKLAVEAEGKLGLPGLMPQQISRSPFLRKLAGQAGATLRTIDDYWLSQQYAATEALKNLRTTATGGPVISQMRALYTKRLSDVTGLLGGKIRMGQGGAALQAGIEEYDNMARYAIDQAYDAARNVEAPTFDLTPALRVIDELSTGRPYATASGEVANAAEGGLSADVVSVMNHLRGMDPSVPSVNIGGRDYTQADALIYLRNKLWEEKTPAPGELFRQSHRDAARLYDEITGVLQNPTNTDATFAGLWMKANDLAKQRFEVWDKAVVREAARSETPGELTRNFMQPNNFETLQYIKDIVPAERWVEMSQAWQTDALRQGADLHNYLNSFDQETLDVMFNEGQQQVLREVATGFENLEQTGVKEALDRQTQQGLFVRQLLETGDSARISALLDNVGEPERLALRAGLIDNIVQDATTHDGKNIPIINVEAIRETLARLKDNGADKILTREDITNLNLLAEYSAISRQGADTGTSIQAAEAVAGARSLKLSAFHTIAEQIGIGRLMTSDFGRRIFFGSGQNPRMDFLRLKMLGAMMGTIANEMTQQ